MRKTLLGGQGQARGAATAARTRKEGRRRGERSGWPRVQNRGSRGPDELEVGVRGEWEEWVTPTREGDEHLRKVLLLDPEGRGGGAGGAGGHSVLPVFTEG